MLGIWVIVSTPLQTTDHPAMRFDRARIVELDGMAFDCGCGCCEGLLDRCLLVAIWLLDLFVDGNLKDVPCFD